VEERGEGRRGLAVCLYPVEVNTSMRQCALRQLARNTSKVGGGGEGVKRKRKEDGIYHSSPPDCIFRSCG